MVAECPLGFTSSDFLRFRGTSDSFLGTVSYTSLGFFIVFVVVLLGLLARIVYLEYDLDELNNRFEHRFKGVKNMFQYFDKRMSYFQGRVRNYIEEEKKNEQRVKEYLQTEKKKKKKSKKDDDDPKETDVDQLKEEESSDSDESDA